DRAAGNPFFAEELSRVLTPQTGSGHNIFPGRDSANPDAETVLPDTITAVLDLRLGRLSAPCHQLLAKAAILGRSFTFQLINEMETGPRPARTVGTPFMASRTANNQPSPPQTDDAHQPAAGTPPMPSGE